MVFTGQGIFTGGLTTAGAFLAMGLTNFKGIQEMGIICGGGLVDLPGADDDHAAGAAAARAPECDGPRTGRASRRSGRASRTSGCSGRSGPPASRWRCARWRRRRSTRSISITTCSTCRAKGLPAVEFEKELIRLGRPSPCLFGAVIATNLQQAVALEQQLTNLPAVASVDSITSFLSEDQTRKLAMVGEIKQELASMHFADPDPKPVDLQELSGTLYSLRGYLGAALDSVQKDAPDLVPQLQFPARRHRGAAQGNVAGRHQPGRSERAQAGRVPTEPLQRCPRHVPGPAEPGQPRPVARGGSAAGLARPVRRRDRQVPADGLSQGGRLEARDPEGVYRPGGEGRSERDRHAGAALPLHGPAQGAVTRRRRGIRWARLRFWCSSISAVSPASCWRWCRWRSVRSGWAA